MRPYPQAPDSHLARAELLALPLVLLLLLVQLMWPPMVGVANNGDFERLMKWGGLEYVVPSYEEKYFGWINREFRFEKSPWRAWIGFGSSEAIFIKLAAIIGDWTLPGDRFDLRALGVIHLIAFVAALWLLLRGWKVACRRSMWFLLPGFLLLFCDLGYTAYFNSFYSEPSTLIFLLAMVGAGLLLTVERRIDRLLLFCLCAGLFIASRVQNFTLIPILLVLCARLFSLNRDRGWRLTLAVFTFSLVAAAAMLNIFARWYTHNGRYQSTFFGILKGSPTPAKDLIDLGLDPQFAVLANTTIFHPNLPIDIRSLEFHEQFFERTDHLKITRFYLAHPSRLLSKLGVTAESAYTLRPDHAGNFEKASGAPAAAKAARWSFWSSFKKNCWPKSLWFLTSFCLLLLVPICRGYPRAAPNGKLIREFFFSLWLMMISAFVTPIIGDGESDLERHLFLFNALFDLSLLLVSGWLLDWIWRASFRRRATIAPSVKMKMWNGL